MRRTRRAGGSGGGGGRGGGRRRRGGREAGGGGGGERREICRQGTRTDSARARATRKRLSRGMRARRRTESE